MDDLQTKRVNYIDNLRWIIVVAVVVFHVVDTFNSTGTIIHFNAPGVPAFDTFGYFVYPWFMACLFLVSGISARYALRKRSDSAFAKERCLRLLLPFITYMLLFAYQTAASSFDISNGWADFAAVPQPLLYFIMISIGMGHAWFLLELFMLSMVFLLFVKLVNREKLCALGAKGNDITFLLLLYIPLLGAAQVLNFLGVFRNLLFLLLFLLGFFVFSNESVIQILKKYRLSLLVAALVLFVIQTVMYWGKSFSSIVNEPMVMLYTWIMILAVLGNASVWLDFSNKFTAYMNKRSFSIYLFHYLPMIYIAYFVTRYLSLPTALNYLVVLIATTAATFVICEVIARIPVIRFLFGVKK